MYLILLDMDGVLCDLEKDLSTWSGQDITDKDIFYELLPAFAVQCGFANLSKTKTADELVKYLLSLDAKLAICTSGGDFFSPVSEIMVQKKRWLEKNFPELSSVPFILTTSGKDKSFFANETTILIDDYASNCNKFVKEGGGTIVYNGNDETSLADVKLILSRIFNKG